MYKTMKSAACSPTTIVHIRRRYPFKFCISPSPLRAFALPFGLLSLSRSPETLARHCKNEESATAAAAAKSAKWGPKKGEEKKK